MKIESSNWDSTTLWIALYILSREQTEDRVQLEEQWLQQYAFDWFYLKGKQWSYQK